MRLAWYRATWMSPICMPLAPTCSRNQAAGILPSRTTAAGTPAATARGNSRSRKFLKMLPAHFMVGGNFSLRTLRISAEIRSSSTAEAASPVNSTARGPLLDVGCGGGLFLGMMRRRGLRVVGLDFSREAAGIAWRRQQVPALAGDLERAPLRAGSFAGLTMFHVMEHLYDPRAYLAAARELLAPDGRLVVQAPNAASWQARLLGRAWNGADIPRHLTDFRGGDLEKMVESAGFE